jgi:L-lactate dehydrogenase
MTDMSDCSFMTGSKIVSGTFKDASQADVIVIAAGAKQVPGEDRIHLIERNFRILKSCISSMQPLNPSAVLLLISNPVDVLTLYAQKISGLPPSQGINRNLRHWFIVIGSGTFLDTARLRSYLSTKLNVSDNAIHAYVLGEHGDSQFIAWSSAYIASTPLVEYEAMKAIDIEKIASDIKEKAYKIIDCKGSTYYGTCYANSL